MINSYLAVQIKENFPFVPTEEQNFSIEKLSAFILSQNEREILVLNGYAGTGKTTLVGALVKTLDMLNRRCVLMAPTGRAAKVFSAYSGKQAYTVHKRIYRQKSILNNAVFVLNENLHKNTLFIVDEASMISNEGYSTTFGSGHLLDDLIEYVYSGVGCRLLLLGDVAQLPPVGEVESPALSASVLEQYGLKVSETVLKQVMRQTSESGILLNATHVRVAISDGDTMQQPQIDMKGFSDICPIRGDELIERIESCYGAGEDGVEDTIVLCRSNKRANIFNNGIRSRILMREDELNTGDYLMVVKNNYYWPELVGKTDPFLRDKMDFIANGDVVRVRRVKRTTEMYGFRFATVDISFPDFDDYEMEVNLLLNTLQSESPALTRDESERLYQAALLDYVNVRSKREKMKRLRENPYYNALQVKYAYAVTCHKAQGGQWKNVFVDRGFLPADGINVDYYRWLYTAFTRATEKLYLINWS